jgi:hypothetical protein
MGNIVCCDDPCPNCGRHHRKFPQACFDLANDKLIETQLESDEFGEAVAKVLVEDMRSYGGFWSVADGDEREGDCD